MRKRTAAYADPACRMPPDNRARFLKPRPKTIPTASLTSRLGGGFLLPALVVCVALWLLLSGARLI